MSDSMIARNERENWISERANMSVASVISFSARCKRHSEGSPRREVRRQRQNGSE